MFVSKRSLFEIKSSVYLSLDIEHSLAESLSELMLATLALVTTGASVCGAASVCGE